MGNQIMNLTALMENVCGSKLKHQFERMLIIRNLQMINSLSQKSQDLGEQRVALIKAALEKILDESKTVLHEIFSYGAEQEDYTEALTNYNQIVGEVSIIVLYLGGNSYLAKFEHPKTLPLRRKLDLN